MWVSVATEGQLPFRRNWVTPPSVGPFKPTDRRRRMASMRSVVDEMTPSYGALRYPGCSTIVPFRNVRPSMGQCATMTAASSVADRIAEKISDSS
ncbi:unnamed protein product [Soboliphyme baturini]|uniref:Uncharacterized protein n=1 Tax=Soboliphyme baturini TaxID=241478 RepID=A0A183IFV0_9BILA|nr:unnamed protein product [Soboliphyme baturini]